MRFEYPGKVKERSGHKILPFPLLINRDNSNFFYRTHPRRRAARVWSNVSSVQETLTLGGETWRHLRNNCLPQSQNTIRKIVYMLLCGMI